MNHNLIKSKLVEYKDTLDKLEKSLIRATRDETHIDTSLQNFKQTYEESYDLIKAWVKFNSTKHDNLFLKAVELDLIYDLDNWIQMMENVEKLSNPYDEETAKEIYDKIKMEYLIYFNELKVIIDSELASYMINEL